jgi:hypothetical protein
MCRRAKENLIITYPVNIYDRESGMVLSKPSRFIEGIEEKLLSRGWWMRSETAKSKGKIEKEKREQPKGRFLS